MNPASRACAAEQGFQPGAQEELPMSESSAAAVIQSRIRGSLTRRELEELQALEAEFMLDNGS
jgi:hypothetical protein